MAAVSDASSGHLRRCSDANMTKKSLSRAKDASILPRPTREIRYGCQQRRWRPSQMPHQVTYDVVVTLIQLKRA
eukprot:scaffold9754_cov91-Skeletonema_marinoi.AAC.3